MKTLDTIDFKKSGGLVPVIVQDEKSLEVLMLAYADKSALEKTLELGFAHYYSRSRNKMWLKGESSGNTQKISEVLFDCDNDTILYKVNQKGGAACHTGRQSCFFNRLSKSKIEFCGKDVFDPKDIYNKDK